MKTENRHLQFVVNQRKLHRVNVQFWKHLRRNSDNSTWQSDIVSYLSVSLLLWMKCRSLWSNLHPAVSSASYVTFCINTVQSIMPTSSKSSAHLFMYVPNLCLVSTKVPTMKVFSQFIFNTNWENIEGDKLN